MVNYRKLSVIQASYPATTPSPTRVSYHDAIPHTHPIPTSSSCFFSPSSLQSRRGSTTHTEQPGGLLLHQLQRLHAGTRPMARGKMMAHPFLYFPLPPCRGRLTCSWRHYSQPLLYFPLPPFRGRLTCSWRHYSQPLLYFPLPPFRGRLTCSWRHYSQTLLYFPLPPFRGRLTCSWRHYQTLLSPLSDV